MISTSTNPLSNVISLGREIPWLELDEDRRSFQREFVRLALECPGFRGRVLDIGCGGELPAALEIFEGQFGTLDGVDPSPAVMSHPLLERRWQGAFETSAVPADAYDLAYAYNVLEHIADPRPFFEKVFSALKPGGVFVGLTPNAGHPFAVLSRSIELLGLKGFARARIGRSEETGEMAVNDYPAYYRSNSPRAIRQAIHGLGFRRATYYYFPCLQWDTYFPRVLRWAPRLYDYVLGTRVSSLMQIFIVQLEK